jgi:hypothetical protein
MSVIPGGYTKAGRREIPFFAALPMKTGRLVGAACVKTGEWNAQFTEP